MTTWSQDWPNKKGREEAGSLVACAKLAKFTSELRPGTLEVGSLVVGALVSRSIAAHDGCMTGVSEGGSGIGGIGFSATKASALTTLLSPGG